MPGGPTYGSQGDADTPNIPGPIDEAWPKRNTALWELQGQQFLCPLLALEVTRQDSACTSNANLHRQLHAATQAPSDASVVWLTWKAVVVH